jgi:hypothetical protein
MTFFAEQPSSGMRRDDKQPLRKAGVFEPQEHNPRITTIMEERLRNRLEALKREYEFGQNKLRELVSEETELRQTLLRISGAIQVLEEALAQGAKPDEAATAPDSPAAEQVSETP